MTQKVLFILYYYYYYHYYPTSLLIDDQKFNDDIYFYFPRPPLFLHGLRVGAVQAQDADPPPLPLSAAKAGRNNLNE